MEPRPRFHVLAAAALAASALLYAAPARARALMTQKEALGHAFPSGEKVERLTVYLTDGQLKAAQEQAHAKIDSRVWSYYVGRSTVGVDGYAYFDSHVVRTMPETLMVVLEPSGQVRFVEVLSFLEPDDYLPNGRWLGQFRGKSAQDDLIARRGIRNIGGASLTAAAAADAVRRVLAVHAAVRAAEAAKR